MVEYFDRVLRTNPKNEIVLLTWAVPLPNLKNMTRLVHFDKVLLINPRNADALYDKGVTLAGWEV